jgi:hypothetical protein
MVNAPIADRGGEHRAEPVPPHTHRFVADIDLAFEQQIFHLPQRERIADVHDHGEADHVGRAVEAAEGIAHRRRLWIARSGLKPICFDNAISGFARMRFTGHRSTNDEPTMWRH